MTIREYIKEYKQTVLVELENAPQKGKPIKRFSTTPVELTKAARKKPNLMGSEILDSAIGSIDDSYCIRYKNQYRPSTTPAIYFQTESGFFVYMPLKNSLGISNERAFTLWARAHISPNSEDVAR